MKRALLAYYSKTGSTLQIINQIADYLSSQDMKCTVLKFNEVTSVMNYDLIIIGAPINGFQYVQDAIQFIHTFESDLKSIPTATFALSYLSDYPRPFFRRMIQKNFNQAVQGISPYETAIFGGLSNGSLPKLIQWLFGLPNQMPTDTRDFAAIDQWIKGLVASKSED